MEVIDNQHLRLAVTKCPWMGENTVPNEALIYVAGFFDMDGTCVVDTNSSNSITIKVAMCQSEKGIAALHFVHQHIGGIIINHVAATAKNQRSYMWYLLGEEARAFCAMLAPYVLVKKRELLLAAEFPTINVHTMPVIATNQTSSEELTFENAKVASKHFGKNYIVSKEKPEVVFNGWRIRRQLDDEGVKTVLARREEIRQAIAKLRGVPHDPIPADVQPHAAYFAGLADGDCSFDTARKNTQKHCMTKKYRPILDVLLRTFGGTIVKTKTEYKWEIYTNADKFLRTVAPYLVGKRAQADLILNMKPGEGELIHAQLRALKGNCGVPTPLIDKTLQDAAPSTTEAKKLPRGVFAWGTKFVSQLQHDKKVYKLGVFDNAEAAKTEYDKWFDAVQLMKRGGPVVDFEGIQFAVKGKSSM